MVFSASTVLRSPDFGILHLSHVKSAQRARLFEALVPIDAIACSRIICQKVFDQEWNDMITAVPYEIHTILTYNGIQFTNRKKDTELLLLLG